RAACTRCATSAIIGDRLAPDPVLATLPISIFVVGMAACILPVGAITRRYGRRAAFMVGTGAGVLTGLLAMLALMQGLFWLCCLSTFFGGGYAAVVLSFRFAAADGVAPARKFHRVRPDGCRIIRIGRPVVHLWLDDRALGVVRAAGTGGPGACVCQWTGEHAG